MDAPLSPLLENAEQEDAGPMRGDDAAYVSDTLSGMLGLGCEQI